MGSNENNGSIVYGFRADRIKRKSPVLQGNRALFFQKRTKILIYKNLQNCIQIGEMLRKKFAISRCVGVRLGAKSKFAVVVNAKKVMKNPLIQQNQGMKYGCGGWT